MAVNFAIFISVFSALGGLLFGLDVGYIAAIIECASFKRDVVHLKNWNDPQAQVSGSISGFVVGIFSLGCIIASFPVFSAYFLDTWGRKASLCLGTLVFSVGAILQAAAFSTTQMLTGRLIAGLSIGLLSNVVALYQSELSPASMRGSLTSIYQLMITVGIFTASFLNWMLVEGENGWRLAILVQLVPASALLLGMLCLPRSPRWLVNRGHFEEARDVLKSLRDSDAEADDEFQEIVASVEAVKIFGEPLWTELFEGRVAKLAALGIALALLSQLCGMNAFMYFGPRIFAAAGFAPVRFQMLITGVNVVATFPAIILADRCGRTALLMWGALGMTIASIIMGATGNSAFSKTSLGGLASDSTVAPKIIMVCVIVFCASFAASWGAMVWVYCAEIFPLKHRSRCMGLTTTAIWSGNYIIAQFTPMLLESIGFSTFYIFAAFSFIGLLLSLWIPETKGVLLEHINRLFDEKFGVEDTMHSINSGMGLRTNPITKVSSVYGTTASSS
mmetsp:Transcript_155374/g.286356  ORF Transcript_155374/g.286356 Transcript_155374/m.286356 type:complete len:504 (-) Transcript_155374:54-1565(-)